jgi:cold-inducible RNA-binding protein
MGTSIFVGNLPRSTDTAELSKVFEAYGDVVDARVITDRATGQSKGYAFVEMRTEDEMRRAIAELDGMMLGDRALRLDEAKRRPRDPQAQESNGRDRSGYSDRSRYTERTGSGVLVPSAVMTRLQRQGALTVTSFVSLIVPLFHRPIVGDDETTDNYQRLPTTQHRRHLTAPRRGTSASV